MKELIFMKKTTIRIISVIICLIIATLTFAACGSSKSAENEACYDYPEDNASYEYGFEESAEAVDESGDVKASTGNAIADKESRKLIRDADIDVETKEFDSFINKLETQVSKTGGYIENSSVSGSSYYSDCTRNATITLRIPTEEFDSFLGTIGDMANVMEKSISVRDITSQYIDTEARIKALKSEQTALLTLLEKAESVTDIIEIQGRISEVNAELDSYESQLKTYDNLVSYSTINLTVYEVERISPVKQEGFFAEIKENLKENFYNIGQGIRDFAVWFISSLPYIVIYGIILVIIIVIIKRIIKKRKAKKTTV